ncbi:MAG: hypothetical protein A2542_03640 [Parcubacteria group bacterium RIFOXYD2_FULL_52_8]|nr:MAG: hypothetical protein A2542_03640 [Parcubacteria group bacterium RIFOXYD2_FULL_52_8]
MSQTVRDAIERLRDLQGTSSGIEEASKNLEGYLACPAGVEAMQLLTLTDDQVVFAIDERDTNCVEHYTLTGLGLVILRYAGTGKVATASRRNATALEIVQGAVKHGHKKPCDIIGWLKGQIEEKALQVNRG